MFLNYYWPDKALKFGNAMDVAADHSEYFHSLEAARLRFEKVCGVNSWRSMIIDAFFKEFSIEFVPKKPSKDDIVSRMRADFGKLTPTIYQYDSLTENLTTVDEFVDSFTQTEEPVPHYKLSFTTLGQLKTKLGQNKIRPVYGMSRFLVDTRAQMERLYFGLAHDHGRYYFGPALKIPTHGDYYTAGSLTQLRECVYEEGKAEDMRMIHAIIALIGWEGVLQ